MEISVIPTHEKTDAQDPPPSYAPQADGGTGHRPHFYHQLPQQVRGLCT